MKLFLNAVVAFILVITLATPLYAKRKLNRKLASLPEIDVQLLSVTCKQDNGSNPGFFHGGSFNKEGAAYFFYKEGQFFGIVSSVVNSFDVDRFAKINGKYYSMVEPRAYAEVDFKKNTFTWFNYADKGASPQVFPCGEISETLAN